MHLDGAPDDIIVSSKTLGVLVNHSCNGCDDLLRTVEGMGLGPLDQSGDMGIHEQLGSCPGLRIAPVYATQRGGILESALFVLYVVRHTIADRVQGRRLHVVVA
jgi:hypothetical protein